MLETRDSKQMPVFVVHRLTIISDFLLRFQTAIHLVGGGILVCGVFLGTYFWWGALTITTDLIRKRSGKTDFQRANKIFGMLLVLLTFLIFSLAACSAKGEQPDTSSMAEDTVSSEITEQEEIPASEPLESEQQTETVENTEEPAQPQQTAPGEQGGTEENAEMKMSVQVGGEVFSATLENNKAVSELVAMMQESPVVIEMGDYSGFEKVGSLGRSLTASNSQTTTQAGDIVLYNGNQIVIFYGSNSWSYTRLGHIDDLTGWEDALGSGDVTVTFSLE